MAPKFSSPFNSFEPINASQKMKQCFSIQEPSASASIQPSVAAIVHASRSPLPNATVRACRSQPPCALPLLLVRSFTWDLKLGLDIERLRSRQYRAKKQSHLLDNVSQRMGNEQLLIKLPLLILFYIPKLPFRNQWWILIGLGGTWGTSQAP